MLHFGHSFHSREIRIYKTYQRILGCGFKDTYDYDNLRYHRVVIMTDADVDGSHIRTLLLTFFFRYMREIISNGNLFIALPPLYRVKKGKQLQYLDDDEQLREFKLSGIKGHGCIHCADGEIRQDTLISLIDSYLSAMKAVAKMQHKHDKQIITRMLFTHPLQRNGGDIDELPDLPCLQDWASSFEKTLNNQAAFGESCRVNIRADDRTAITPGSLDDDAGSQEDDILDTAVSEDEGSSEEVNVHSRQDGNGRTVSPDVRTSLSEAEEKSVAEGMALKGEEELESEEEGKAVHSYLVEIQQNKNGEIIVGKFYDDFFSSECFRRSNAFAEKYAQKLSDGVEVSYNEKTIQLADFSEVVDWLFQQSGKGVDIQRYKGLGEMNPEQLWDTTMDPATRRLVQVRIDDFSIADAIFSTLMGDEVAPRRGFIEERALDAVNLDI